MHKEVPGSIVLKEPPILPEHVEAFKKATHSDHTNGIPLTFVTRFRKAEFEWLDRLNINLAEVLHTEQDYEFFEPLSVGDAIEIEAKVDSYRERKVGNQKMYFVSLKSEVRKQKQLLIIARSMFVVRPKGETNP